MFDFVWNLCYLSILGIVLVYSFRRCLQISADMAENWLKRKRKR